MAALHEPSTSKRYIEFLATLVLLCVVTIVVSNYIGVLLTGENSWHLLENFLVTRRNGNRVSITTQADLYQLKRVGSQWQVYKEGSLVDDIVAKDNEGKLTLADKKDEGQNNALTFKVKNVGDYFSRSGEVTTDIPYTSSPSAFQVPEQEDYFPIFGYHNVFENEEDLKDPYIDIREPDFLEQVKYFNEGLNCHWVGLTDAITNYILPKKKLPKNACVMTFDDGRENNFTTALPILKANDVTATFFIISGRLNQKTYLSNFELSEIFRAGNEVGSHTLTGGSLVDTSWYTKGPFTDEVLYDQLYRSKQMLNTYGYQVQIFAYPLGDYNEKTVEMLKKTGYVAARASQKPNPWRDKRALALSMDPDFIWHFNYYEPVLHTDNEIRQEAGYTGWWQFEEGMKVEADLNSNIRYSTENAPDIHSYGLVDLLDAGDRVANNFLLSDNGTYTLQLQLSAPGEAINEIPVKVYLDNRELPVVKSSSFPCVLAAERQFCTYEVSANLLAGEHIISVESQIQRVFLDRFQIKKNVFNNDNYDLIIERQILKQTK